MGAYCYGASFHDSGLSVVTSIPGTHPEALLDGYLKLEGKQRTVNDIEMLEFSCLRIEKEVKRPIEVGMLKWINYIK